MSDVFYRKTILLEDFIFMFEYKMRLKAIVCMHCMTVTNAHVQKVNHNWEQILKIYEA